MNNHTSVEQLALVEDIKIGEFVKRITICKPCNGDGATDRGLCAVCDTKGYKPMSTVYKRAAFMRPDHAFGFKGGYALEDTEDMNRQVCVKKGTRLLVGFTY